MSKLSDAVEALAVEFAQDIVNLAKTWLGEILEIPAVVPAKKRPAELRRRVRRAVRSEERKARQRSRPRVRAKKRKLAEAPVVPPAAPKPPASLYAQVPRVPGMAVKDARLARGWSQVRLAKEAGVKRGLVSHVECDRIAAPSTIRNLLGL